MGGKRKRLVRILALALAALLVLGTMASIVFSHDHAHAEAAAERDGYHLEIAFYEDAQALQIRQRLRYTNRTGKHLDRVEFSVYANIFRRVTALMYEADVWQDVFPSGNAPGGVEFSRILADGQSPSNTLCCSRRTPPRWAWARWVGGCAASTSSRSNTNTANSSPLRRCNTPTTSTPTAPTTR